MKNFFKGKFGTIIILFFTVVLAGVAIFTALRLYQLRSQSVAPNVPSSIPYAHENKQSPTPGSCTLIFTIISASPSPTASPTGTPTASPTATPNATPTQTPATTPNPTANPSSTPNACGGTCGSDSNCGSGYYCNTALGLCRNPSCPNQANCNCPGTVAPTPTPTAPTLPVSGTDWPTILGAGIGLFVIIGSLLLAL